MRRTLVLLVALAMVTSVGSALAFAVRPDDRTSEDRVRVDHELQAQLAAAAPSERLHVFVHAVDVDTATRAARGAGMAVITTFPRVGIAFAGGTPAQIEKLHHQGGVTYVEAHQDVSFFMQTSHAATRSDEALSGFSYEAAAGTVASPGVDGTGVSIAIVDTGVDGNHPMFQTPAGSKVVRNLRPACYVNSCYQPGQAPPQFFVDAPANDSDTTAVAGGHGTHVAGTAAGIAVNTAESDPRHLRGGAPGASLVALSVAHGAFFLPEAALNWILENHASPCEGCPPIRVVNNSYGPLGGGSHDPSAALSKLTNALVDAGVVMVFAAGNDGGDGSVVRTNPFASNPLPGVISVANYDDANSGTRDGGLAGSSSRGLATDPSTYPDVAAPGTEILSACRPWLPDCHVHLGYTPADPNYAGLSGTSMAAPHVAGYVAQLLQANPALTPAQVEDILEDTAYPFTAGSGYRPDPANPDTATSFDKGHGLVDVAAAVARARDLPPAATAARPCATDTVTVDRSGDASRPFHGDTRADFAESEPGLDLTQVVVTALPEGQGLVFSLHVADLPETNSRSTATGTYFALPFGHNGANYEITAQRSPRGSMFRLEDESSVLVGDLEGSFDHERDVVWVYLANARLGEAGLGQIVSGDHLSIGEAFSARLVGAVIVYADFAPAQCAYTVGIGAVLPLPPAPAEEKAAVPPPTTVGDGETFTGEGTSPADNFDYLCSGPGDPRCVTYTLDLRPSTGAGELDVVLETDVFGRVAEDWDVYLYDSRGNEVAVSGLPQTVHEAFVADVATGTYYLVVQPYTATTESPYKVTATLTAN